jgi:hypothetical protein
MYPDTLRGLRHALLVASFTARGEAELVEADFARRPAWCVGW